MERKSRRRGFIVVTMTLWFGLFLYVSLSQAQVKPGDVIDQSNWQKAVDVLPPSVVEMLKTHGLVIHVGESKDYPLSAKWIEATKKYAGTAKLENNLMDYVSGTPFPDINMDDPQAAIKIAWNSQYRSRPESSGLGKPWTSNGAFIWINKDKIVRTVDAWNVRIYFVGRTEDPPIPIIPNKEGIIYKEIFYPTSPQDVAGVGFLTIRYNSVNKDDDAWLYAPVLRRVRRMSGAQQTDSLIGSYITVEDYWCFSGKITNFDWKLLGRKKMLVLRDTKQMPIKFGGNKYKWCPVDVPWELRDVYILENIPKMKGHPYKKRILYVDTQWWDYYYSEMYDRKGEFWKLWLQPWFWDKDTNWFQFPGHVLIDFQALYATNSTAYTIGHFKGMKPEQLSIDTLEKWGR